MNNLINIQINEHGNQMVSAKDLYLGLGLNKAVWSRWYKTNIQNNDFFTENIDWVGVQHDVEGNETMDFAITLEFAKHIALMAKTDKSHEYRNYFIKCEEKLKEDSLNISELSPELQMFNKMLQAVAKSELEQKKIKQQLNEVNHHVLEAKEVASKSREEVQAIREVVAINTSNWREDSRKMIVKMAHNLGGNGYIHAVQTEVYSLMKTRLRCKLDVQLTNMRRRMADEGVCKSKRDKLNYLDVIDRDSRLKEGYLAIVKELAIKYGVGGI